MNGRLPSLSGLRAFEATARNLSVTLAADELSVTPGAVSLQIRDLEEALGVRLFERKPRRLILTEDGAVSYTHLDVYKRQSMACTKPAS